MNKTERNLSKKELETISKEEIRKFKQFAFKGKMMELAVAFIIGSAFQKTVESISTNIIMPIANFFILQTGKNWRHFNWTPIEGITFGIGNFIGSFVDFLVISIILYIIYIKLIQPLFDAKEDQSKLCNQCLSNIPVNAKRCSKCTSWINENE